nr:PIG-L family deacetylase [uncultured Desulfobacter sp.]
MPTLVIAAHPDDETLGCGGTIARLASEQKEVHILILGEGITSRQTDNRTSANEEISMLKKNSRQAGAILGVADIHLESFPDNKFDSIPLLDIVKVVESYIEKISPHTVFTHHGGDLNIDHSVTSRAVLTATRPMPGSPVKRLYAFETLSATEWSFGQIGQYFTPNCFINIQNHIHQKIEAMEAYGGEIRNFPHPRSAKAIKTLANLRGSMAGMAFAEAFSIVRTIKDL